MKKAYFYLSAILLISLIVLVGCGGNVDANDLSGKASSKTGNLFVSSSPTKASVYVDNRLKGSTPITVKNLAAGQHSLKLTKSGYYDWLQGVNISTDKTTSINAILTQIIPPGDHIITVSNTVGTSNSLTSASTGTVKIRAWLYQSGNPNAKPVDASFKINFVAPNGFISSEGHGEGITISTGDYKSQPVGDYILSYSSGGPRPSPGKYIINRDYTGRPQILKLEKHGVITFNFYFAEAVGPPPSTGTMKFLATFNSKPWFGILNFTVSTPSLPGTILSRLTGYYATAPNTYTVSVASGPPMAIFNSVTPSAQILPIGGVITFKNNFTIDPNCLYYYGNINGYKVKMPGNQNVNPPANEKVTLDNINLPSPKPYTPPTTLNPYSFQSINACAHTVAVTVPSVPSGWSVGYTLCYNDITCHGNTPTPGSSAEVIVPANGFADLWWHYTPPPTGNNAQFIPPQSVPSTMIAGEKYTVSVTMKNTGDTTWTANDKYRLGSQDPQDSLLWNIGRVNLNLGESIAPGETKTFKFIVNAPAFPGKYDFQWRMVQENVEWFGDFTPNVNVEVTGTSTQPGGIWGQVWNDLNGNGGDGPEEGEPNIRDPNSECFGRLSDYPLDVPLDVPIRITGNGVDRTIKPNLCWPTSPYVPYFDSGLTLPPGKYTVTIKPPDGWVLTTPENQITFPVPTNDHIGLWVGMRQQH